MLRESKEALRGVVRTYLENAERPPIHLLRIFPDDEMSAEEIDQGPISNEQASLFDSE